MSSINDPNYRPSAPYCNVVVIQSDGSVSSFGIMSQEKTYALPREQEVASFLIAVKSKDVFQK